MGAILLARSPFTIGVKGLAGQGLPAKPIGSIDLSISRLSNPIGPWVWRQSPWDNMFPTGPSSPAGTWNWARTSAFIIELQLDPASPFRRLAPTLKWAFFFAVSPPVVWQVAQKNGTPNQPWFPAKVNGAGIAFALTSNRDVTWLVNNGT
jgi:hypothetical protein